MNDAIKNELSYVNKTFPCIGKDEKIHACYPWAEKCSCGMEIKSKKPTRQDFVDRYSCYECTY